MKKTILIKLILKIGLPILLIASLVLGYDYKITKKNAINETKKYLFELTEHNAGKIDKEFREISQTAFGIKNLIESSNKISENQIFKFCVGEMKKDKDNVGCGVAFVPNKIKDFNNGNFANLIHKSNGKYISSDLSKKYDYVKEDWFVISYNLRKGYWSEPFFGKISKKLLMVKSEPIFKKDKLIGISYADISLQILSDLIKKIRIAGGYTFIISKNGTFIYHPNKNYVMKESIFSLAKQFNRPILRKVGRKMVHTKSGTTGYRDLDNNEKKWVVFAPIQSTGWSFAAVIPERYIVDQVKKRLIKQMRIMFVGLAFILFIIILIAKSVSTPLKKLSVAANEIASGNLDVEIDELKGEDELAVLGQAFNKMSRDLKSYIKNLTDITKAKEAVESEMRIARQIQESLLPRIFPPFPDRTEFDLFAGNIAAKEVAGDFYDFFLLNENLMAVIIADVSGKGISAGLFMAVTRTLIKTVCSADISPAEALTKANNILCQDNDACMFTTLFLCFYEISTGKIIYSNAGHDYPFVLSKNGECKKIITKQDIALGIDDEHEYQNGEIILEDEQTLILYTDGVIEATNSENILFGEERFIEILSKNAESSLEKMLNTVTRELAEFQNNNQFDDITLLFLKKNKEL